MAEAATDLTTQLASTDCYDSSNSVNDTAQGKNFVAIATGINHILALAAPFNKQGKFSCLNLVVE